MLKVEEGLESCLVQLSDVKIVDDTRIHKLTESLLGIVCRKPYGRLIEVDLGGVQFMTSAMIGRLIIVHKAARKAGNELRLTNIRPRLFKVFRLMRLDRVLRIEEAAHSEPRLLPLFPYRNTGVDTIAVAQAN